MPELFSAPRCLFVSPHLDDAVLSVGGLIAERTARGLRSTVLTVFAGAPVRPWSAFAGEFHAACGLGEGPVGVRRAEDRAALATVGAEPSHADLLDAIYRSGPDGAWLYDEEDLWFRPAPAADAPTVALVADVVAEACRSQRPDVLLGPLAIGDHVDHILARDAVLSVAAGCGLPVLLWEDQPYALLYGAPPVESGDEIVPVGAAAWERRLAAAGEYRSQMRMLFDAGQPWRDLFTRYASGVGGGQPAERLRPA